MRDRFSRFTTLRRIAQRLTVCGALVTAMLPAAHGQFAAPQLAPAPATAAVPPVAAAMPEPIYWKQDLFLIPYQWGSPAEPAAAQAVWLFLSKDRGATWQKISEAQPQVRAFNYRADGEGEYWFTIRTRDQQGRTWPAGAHQPELRVIVDTTIPRIEDLRAQILSNGQIGIAWRYSDTHLDPSSLSIEAQVDAAGTWQPISLSDASAAPQSVTTTALGLTSSGQIQWQPPTGIRPLAIRASVADLAKNTATYRTELSLVAGAGGAFPAIGATAQHAAPNAGGLITAPTATSVPAAPAPSGWVSASAAPSQGQSRPVNQPWPATATGRSPFRLSSIAATPNDDGVTAYGSPPVTTSPAATPPVTPAPPDDRGADNTNAGPRVESNYSTATLPAAGGIEEAPVNGLRFAARDPFKSASVTRLPLPEAQPSPPIAASSMQSPIGAPPAATASQSIAATPSATHTHVPPDQVKRVGSRTFALEYDLDDAGRWGVSKVELWGSRDGGNTWHSYARDDDHRSPLVVTVDEEGLYGFRIAVDIAGSAAAAPPRPGDQPELWVSVDLHRPVVELTAIERGDGNLGDHLIFRWKVSDDNLEPRPIALFYSSRPTGPWSAIATNLEDTGEYAWRVDRFVPARFFVRVEARDTAGNLAAFQTREPIEFAPLGAGGHLRSAEPVGPTASSESSQPRR